MQKPSEAQICDAEVDVPSARIQTEVSMQSDMLRGQFPSWHACKSSMKLEHTKIPESWLSQQRPAIKRFCFTQGFIFPAFAVYSTLRPCLPHNGVSPVAGCAFGCVSLEPGLVTWNLDARWQVPEQLDVQLDAWRSPMLSCSFKFQAGSISSKASFTHLRISIPFADRVATVVAMSH